MCNLHLEREDDPSYALGLYPLVKFYNADVH